MEENVIYTLYNNKKDKNLLAFAYSKDQIKDVSLEFTEGVWYKHDVEVTQEGTTLLWNEKEFKTKVRFGTQEEIDALKKERAEALKSGIKSTGLRSDITLR